MSYAKRSYARRFENSNEFERTVRRYLKQGREKLLNDLTGTREAIKIIAVNKTRDFMETMDKGLDKDEREFLNALFVASMIKSFCYGYGIGKIEGSANNKIFL